MEADELFDTPKGQEAIDYVCNQLKARLKSLGLFGNYLSAVITPKLVKYLINSTLGMIQEGLDIKKKFTEVTKIELAKEGVGIALGMAKDLDFDGDRNLVSNDQLEEIGKKLSGEFFADADYKTNFKDVNELRARAGVKVKF